jgi:uncharacterized membrane protein YqhA
MARFLALTRYLVIIPVIASLVGALVLMLYGAVATVIDSAHTFEQMLSGSDKGIKSAAVQFIELVDVFLLSTVLYIIGVGLYELFIGKLDMPDWLVISTLDDLKTKLISVVVTVLSVLFLGQVVSWDGQTNLLIPGAGIALVIGALTLFLSQQDKKKAKDEKKDAGQY